METKLRNLEEQIQLLLAAQAPKSVEDFEKLLNDERLAIPQWQFKRVKEDYNITMETRHNIKSIWKMGR